MKRLHPYVGRSCNEQHQIDRHIIEPDGVGADGVKAGAPAQGERVAKYIDLLL
jgi:enolase